MAVKKDDRVKVKDDYELPSVRGQQGIVVAVGRTGTVSVRLDDRDLNYKLSPWGGGMVPFQWFELEAA